MGLNHEFSERLSVVSTTSSDESVGFKYNKMMGGWRIEGYLEKAGDWMGYSELMGSHLRYVRVHESGVLISLHHRGDNTARSSYVLAHATVAAARGN